jgi:hypothetical protein
VQLSEEYYKLTLDITMTGPTVADGGDQAPDPPPPGAVEPPMDTLSAMIVEGVNGGNNAYSEDDPDQDLVLYDGVTYHFEVTVSHSHGAPATTSNYLTFSMWRTPIDGSESGVTQQAWDQNMGAARLGTAYSDGSRDHTTNVPSGGTAGVTYSHWSAHLRHTGYAGTNGWGSSVTVTASYVSGPDPRFP